MQKLIPFCGLPRSGSTLLCNVLGQHPDVTLSADSLLPAIVSVIMSEAEKIIQESQYDADFTYKLFDNFVDSGIKSWAKNISDTKFYLDKSRGWSDTLNFLFGLYPDIKLIFTIRDLRGIYLSFDRLSQGNILSGGISSHYDEVSQQNNDADFLEERIDFFLNGDMVKKHLNRLKEIIDLDRWYSKNIKIVKYEDFMQNPNKVLKSISNFLDLNEFNYDLNDITQVKYNDCIYLPYGYHKLKKTLTPSIPNYDDKLRKSAQNKIFKDYRWYYSLFYPEVLR